MILSVNDSPFWGVRHHHHFRGSMVKVNDVEETFHGNHLLRRRHRICWLHLHNHLHRSCRPLHSRGHLRPHGIHHCCFHPLHDCQCWKMKRELLRWKFFAYSYFIKTSILKIWMISDVISTQNTSSVNLLIIHCIFGSLRILRMFVVDKCEATGSTGLGK